MHDKRVDMLFETWLSPPLSIELTQSLESSYASSLLSNKSIKQRRSSSLLFNDDLAILVFKALNISHCISFFIAYRLPFILNITFSNGESILDHVFENGISDILIKNGTWSCACV